MTHRSILLASLMLAAGAPCGAQSQVPPPTAPASPAPAAASTGVTAPATATQATVATSTAGTAAKADSAKGSPAVDASSEPSPEIVKEARREGFRPKKRNGVTMFCRTDATLGTRFETEKCYDQQHIEMLVEERQDERDQLHQQQACTGCSGH